MSLLTLFRDKNVLLFRPQLQRPKPGAEVQPGAEKARQHRRRQPQLPVLRPARPPRQRHRGDGVRHRRRWPGGDLCPQHQQRLLWYSGFVVFTRGYTVIKKRRCCTSSIVRRHKRRDVDAIAAQP